MTDILSQLESFSADDLASLREDRASRYKALQLLQDITAKVELPMDTLLRIVWKEVPLAASLQICHDLGVFKVLSTSDDFMSIEQISEATNGIEPALLRRFLRHIATMGLLRQKETDLYGSTPFSKAMTEAHISSAIEFWSYVVVPSFTAASKFFEENGWRNPSDVNKTPFQMAKGTTLHFWDYLNKHPKLLASFASHMKGYASTRGSWLDVFPGQSILDGADDDGPLIVDVAGGLGQDITKFYTQFPQKAGRLVLQDLPKVIEEGKGKLDSSITAMGHDIFTPQPVKRKCTQCLPSKLQLLTRFRCSRILYALDSP
jgi:hypothetical protein